MCVSRGKSREYPEHEARGYGEQSGNSLESTHFIHSRRRNTQHVPADQDQESVDDDGDNQG